MKSLTAIFVLALSFAPGAIAQDASPNQPECTQASGCEPECDGAAGCEPECDNAAGCEETCTGTSCEDKPERHDESDEPCDDADCPSECEGMSAEACKEAYCKEHPADCRDGCADMSKEECMEAYCEDHPEKCEDTPAMTPRQYCAQHPDASRCKSDDGAALDGLRHIEFTVDEGRMTMEDYSVSGHLIFDSITIDAPAGTEVSAKLVGSVLVVKSTDWELRLHDNPTGTISYKGTPDLILVLPDDADARLAAHGATIDYEENGRGHLASQGVALEDETLVVAQKMAFVVKPMVDDDDDDDRVRQAQARGDVGGEIKIRSSARAQSENADKVEVVQYDDVTMTVEAPEKATRESPLVVTFDADLSEGRTFVLDLDPDLIVGPELELRYFDINDDGSKTEVVFQQAASLVDVLDATQGDQPEYWVVKDVDGWQVLVKVPHWSVHQITLASIGEFVTQPSVLIGIGAGVAGVAVASIAMLRPRR